MLNLFHGYDILTHEFITILFILWFISHFQRKKNVFNRMWHSETFFMQHFTLEIHKIDELFACQYCEDVSVIFAHHCIHWILWWCDSYICCYSHTLLTLLVLRQIYFRVTRSVSKLWLPWLLTAPGGRLNIKMSYQYRDPHVINKTVSQPSYL